MAKKQVVANLEGARAGCLGITVDKNPFIDETWIVKWPGSVVMLWSENTVIWLPLNKLNEEYNWDEGDPVHSAVITVKWLLAGGWGNVYPLCPPSSPYMQEIFLRSQFTSSQFRICYNLVKSECARNARRKQVTAEFAAETGDQTFHLKLLLLISLELDAWVPTLLHLIWFPLFTEQVCNESEVLRKFWSQSLGASYQLFRSSLSTHFHLGKRFIRISRGIWNSNLCLLILDLGQPLPSPMKWTCMKSNMRKRTAAEEVVDDDDDENASNIAFPHFPSPEHNNRKTRKYQHLENSCNMEMLKMRMLLKVMMM